MMINYYEKLDSFRDKKDESKVFAVSVKLVSGGFIDSSSMPISYLEEMIATIEASDAAHTALSIWNHSTKRLVLIPHNRIELISIGLN